MDDFKSGAAIPRTPSISWLLEEGAQAATPGTLLAQICARLVAEGLPIANASLSVASLDPLIKRSRLRWRRNDGRVIEEVQFHGMSFRDEAQRPLSLRFTGSGHGREIDWVVEGTSEFALGQREYLQAVYLAMKAPLQAVVEREMTRSLLRAYLGRRSSEKVLSGTVRRGTGETIEAIIWFSDLRDFTWLSDAYPLEQVIKALNDYCARLVGAIQPFGGEVLKFIGDGLLAIFPLAAHGAKAACEAALAATRAARQGMARLDEERLSSGLPPLPFGLALHVGEVMYGNIGAPDRLDFTAIGPAVNVVSRIQGFCRPLGCPVLVSEEFAKRCAEPLTPLGRHPLRGVAAPIALFTITELSPLATLS